MKAANCTEKTESDRLLDAIVAKGLCERSGTRQHLLEAKSVVRIVRAFHVICRQA